MRLVSAEHTSGAKAQVPCLVVLPGMNPWPTCRSLTWKLLLANRSKGADR